MCHDLKAKKFALDPLRALEFGAGEDEPLSKSQKTWTKQSVLATGQEDV